MTYKGTPMGLAAAADDKSMEDGNWKYDTRLKKLTVDLEANPKHLDVFEMNGGTKWVMNQTIEDSRLETLFEIEHGMPFPPEFLCYFYTYDAPAARSGMIGRYSFQRAFMLYNAIALGEEGMYAEVDETHFRIVHYADTFAFGSGSTTMYGSDFKFRVRYELLNQRAVYLGGKGY